MSELQFLAVSDILSTVCCDTDNKQQLCPSWRVGACTCH